MNNDLIQVTLKFLNRVEKFENAIQESQEMSAVVAALVRMAQENDANAEEPKDTKKK